MRRLGFFATATATPQGKKISDIVTSEFAEIAAEERRPATSRPAKIDEIRSKLSSMAPPMRCETGNGVNNRFHRVGSVLEWDRGPQYLVISSMLCTSQSRPRPVQSCNVVQQDAPHFMCSLNWLGEPGGMPRLVPAPAPVPYPMHACFQRCL